MTAPFPKPKPSVAAAILIPLAIWIVFSIVAVVLFFVLGLSRLSSSIDDLARIDPGVETTVTLESAGGYRVWAEYPDNGSGIDPIPTGVTVTVTAPNGDDVPVEDYFGSLNYSDGDRYGVAVMTFDIDEPGDYRITASVDEFSTTPDAFAIGKGNPLAVVGKGALWMVGVGTLGFLIALVLMIVMLVRRGRSKRQLAASAPAPAVGGYGPPGGYPPAGGYGPQGGAPAPTPYGSPGGFPPPPQPSPAPPSVGPAPGPFGAPATPPPTTPAPGPFGTPATPPPSSPAPSTPPPPSSWPPPPSP